MLEPDSQPPSWMLILLRIICPQELLEEIEGDLVQRFLRDNRSAGRRKARRNFIWNVIRFARPEILFRNKFSIKITGNGMIFYYLKMAWRNIAGSKFYSTLNLVGLTLGLAVGLLILIWVNNELNFDSFHSRRDSIYMMTTHLESNGNKFAVSVVQAAIAPHALNEVPGIVNVIRATDLDNFPSFKYKDVALKSNRMHFIDPDFLKMFDYALIEGNRENPFPDVNSVILTQSEAQRFFGDEDPIGKTLIANERDHFVVSGVIRDFPDNTWLHSDMLFSTALRKKIYVEQGHGELDDDWGSYGWQIFVQLEPGTALSAVEEKLTAINLKHQPGMKAVDAGSYQLQPLKDIHLYNADGTPSLIKTVNVFSLVAVLILLIAAINYVNLTTARALMRSKEVSVRKVIGATRPQLFMQFIIHSCLFFFIAVVLAFGLMALSMPLYNSLAGKQLQFDPLDAGLWKIIGSTLVVTLVVSSIYPSLLLSSFQPVKALKGSIRLSKGNGSFRKILVVGQFAFSIGLIICTVIIARQLSFVLNSDLGLAKENILMVPMDKMSEHYESAKAAVLMNPSVEAVSSGNGYIISRWGATLDVDWDGKNQNESFFVHDMRVDRDFLPLLKMELASGSGFSGTRSDSAHFILNETAVKEMGIKDPIGKRFRWHSVEGTIIGVVQDFHFTPLVQRIQPFVFAYSPSSEIMYVKVNGENIPEAISSIEKTWSGYNLGAPFNFSFMDDAYAKHYESNRRTGNLFSLFTGIAVVISCLGLLGLITYTAQMKVKEIGIRKVLGAPVAGIVFLLSKTFIVPVLIAMVIAIPVSWWIMQNWLVGFAYQTDVPWWIYGLSSLGAIAIALITVGFRSVRAAMENPVKSLRRE